MSLIDRKIQDQLHKGENNAIEEENQQPNFPKSNRVQVDMSKLFQAPDSKEALDGNKFSFRNWWISIQASKMSSYEERVDLYERALRYLPGSYKLWYNYLKECVENMEHKPMFSKRYEVINEIFERSLIFMHKMPRIWIMYGEFLMKQNLITRTRQLFDRALLSLPVTQHEKVWQVYREWALSLKDTPKTATSIIKRYLRLNPDFAEEFVEYLIDVGHFDEAAINITKIIDDQSYASPSGKSKYQFLMDLCQLISKNPDKIKSIDCESVIRHGIKKYTDEVGNLYVSLADYFIRQGLFEKARDIFEEALEAVLTARDFGIIFNAYVKFEEEMLNVISERDEGELERDAKLNAEINRVLQIEGEIDQDKVLDEEDEIEYKLYRLEKLVERRPLLLNDCLLRQNPNNVNEWLKRVKLVEKDQNLLLQTFGEALRTIDASKVDGNLSEIWIAFAKFYIANDDWRNANNVYHKATQINFKTLDELSKVWAHWVEIHLGVGLTEDAFKIIKSALFRRISKNENKTVNENITMSVKLWSLYIDMEHNFGTVDTIRSAYKRCIELKVITPQMLLNFASFLQEHHYYEESFKVYETGLAMFDWPVLYDIWMTYLKTFVERYEEDKIERSRDLFDKVTITCPADKKMTFFLMYAELEEKYGLISHAVEVYDRMVEAVPYENKEQAFYIYISKVSNFLGITKTRTIFEKAVEILRDQEMIKMGQRYARLEKKLGEVDRARAIYTHVCQFCDPSDDKFNLWKEWHEFEIQHGNEDTYIEMMRIRRTVMAKYAIAPPDVKKLLEQVEREDEEAAAAQE